MKPNIIVFTGRSVSLKTTTIRSLVALFPNSGTIRATTTRGPRKGDPSYDYQYVSYLEFRSMLDRGEFISWRKNGNDEGRTDDFYAVTREAFNEALASDKIFFRSLTPDTIEKWHAVGRSKIIFIHLIGPDRQETRRRMLERGDNPAEIKRRILQEKNWDTEIQQIVHKNGIDVHFIPYLPAEEIFLRVENLLALHGIFW